MEARKDAFGKTENHVPSDRRKAGRRKNKVRDLFEREGAEAAWVLGLRLGLKATALRTLVC
jgi:hypothetical protein